MDLLHLSSPNRRLHQAPEAVEVLRAEYTFRLDRGGQISELQSLQVEKFVVSKALFLRFQIDADGRQVFETFRWYTLLE